MYKKLFLILFLGLNSGLALSAGSDNCHDLMKKFFVTTNKNNNLQLLKNNWSVKEKELFLEEARALGLSQSHIKIIIDSLNMQTTTTTPARVKNYLSYVLSLSEKEQATALMDLAQLDARESSSKHVKKFLVHEKNLSEKTKKSQFNFLEEKRYQELYYGCRALRPNDVNKNAAKHFKSFNLSLNLGTLGASYAFYNMDKEMDAEWFKKLGYDIASTVLFSYVGGQVQTKATDNQIVKSLKGYFLGRAISVVDIVVYDPMFNKEREKAEARFAELKKNPEYKKEVERLLKIYKERSVYREYKEKLINTLRNLPEGISLGLKGKSVDENNVDWNNLTHADLDRPEVQEVLVAASMAQVYKESRGEWLDTDDTGLDRYVFNAIFYGLQIPKSIAQNFITYRMLCMGQDNPKLAFTRAVIFNVAANFVVNQALFGYREKAINQ